MAKKNFLYLIFFLMLNPLVIGDENNSCTINDGFRCCIETAEDSPFYISDKFDMAGKHYENLRDINNDKIKEKYIPMNGVVWADPKLLKYEASVDFRIPVRVLSVPNEELEETSRKAKFRKTKTPKEERFKTNFLRKLFSGKKGLERAKKGDIGFMDKKSLKQASDYTFIVQESVQLFDRPKGSLLKGKKWRFAMKGGEYLVSRCCPLLGPKGPERPEDEVCEDFNIAEILDESGKVEDYFNLFGGECTYLSNSTPIPNSDIEPISKILDLIKAYSGKVEGLKGFGVEDLEIILTDGPEKKKKVELIKFPFDKKTQIGPFNTRHYVPDDSVNSDSFITPDAFCSFGQFAKKFESLCNKGGEVPGCEILVGNMFHLKNWSHHTSHASGECIDIRPFRKNDDDINEGLTWHDYKKKNGRYIFDKNGHLIADKSKFHPRYDREKTRLFIETAISAGATQVWFNDPVLLKEFEPIRASSSLSPLLQGKPSTKFYNDWWEIGMREMDPHDNHIHICFKKDNPRAQSTCKEGL